jgi:hypothetical protein
MEARSPTSRRSKARCRACRPCVLPG